ncbi:hypothetical protein AYO22_11333 [Fonsecaea multimorphosa]|nr:hypothetical protein AYO22_11333 [Fonsecaea multimorphosa]
MSPQVSFGIQRRSYSGDISANILFAKGRAITGPAQYLLMTLKFAMFAVLSNLIYEAINSLIIAAASINPIFSERFLHADGIFMGSAALELAGLWPITRHVKNTASFLFGFGYGLATGGPLHSLATVGVYISNFVFNAMPALEKYFQWKYKEQGIQYERKVPGEQFPGIY